MVSAVTRSPLLMVRVRCPRDLHGSVMCPRTRRSLVIEHSTFSTLPGLCGQQPSTMDSEEEEEYEIIDNGFRTSPLRFWFGELETQAHGCGGGKPKRETKAYSSVKRKLIGDTSKIHLTCPRCPQFSLGCPGPCACTCQRELASHV